MRTSLQLYSNSGLSHILHFSDIWIFALCHVVILMIFPLPVQPYFNESLIKSIRRKILHAVQLIYCNLVTPRGSFWLLESFNHKDRRWERPLLLSPHLLVKKIKRLHLNRHYFTTGSLHLCSCAITVDFMWHFWAVDYLSGIWHFMPGAELCHWQGGELQIKKYLLKASVIRCLTLLTSVDLKKKSVFLIGCHPQ